VLSRVLRSIVEGHVRLSRHGARLPLRPAKIVRAESLTKRFGDVVAVEDLSFALEQGTITGFLGPQRASASQLTARATAIAWRCPPDSRATSALRSGTRIPIPSNAVIASAQYRRAREENAG
jgi:ABC-type phosphonate transport system ATPase subunit